MPKKFTMMLRLGVLLLVFAALLLGGAPRTPRRSSGRVMGPMTKKKKLSLPRLSRKRS